MRHTTFSNKEKKTSAVKETAPFTKGTIQGIKVQAPSRNANQATTIKKKFNNSII